MRLKNVFRIALVCIGACFITYSLAQEPTFTVQKIHKGAIVIDTHTDTSLKLVNGKFDLSERHEAPGSRVDFPKITAELVKRVYNQEEINKIWGGNFLRVFREVEKTAGYE
jgi:microsomal dipeptidase-like Zn-dependent dipeptidase